MTRRLSRSEANQLYNAKASKLKLKFSKYNKYSFVFVGESDHIKVEVMEGGNKDDIYRYSVNASEFAAPKTFNALMKNYYSVVIIDKSTGNKFEDYHY